jgi:glycosyltransferase involved in cell wall biosynthesis
MPLLSVITINLNNKEGLKKTIKSVISQTFDGIEYIVIDGGSHDGSVDILKENAVKLSHWESAADKGIYDAMNKGIAKATGKYLLFLNSGDVLSENTILSEISEFLTDTDVLYGDLISMEADGKKKFHQSFDEADVNELLLSTIWHPCAFIKRDLFDRYGLYNSDFKLAGDYEFFIRVILKHGATSKHISKYITEFDTTGISHKKDNEELMNKEREIAWRLNFTEVMIDFFKEGLRLSRSRELKLGSMITKLFRK